MYILAYLGSTVDWMHSCTLKQTLCKLHVLDELISPVGHNSSLHLPKRERAGDIQCGAVDATYIGMHNKSYRLTIKAPSQPLDCRVDSFVSIITKDAFDIHCLCYHFRTCTRIPVIRSGLQAQELSTRTSYVANSW